MTEGEERREHIIKLLTQTKKPISGTELARQMKVSRQVIVQDIALLRASNRNILSTNKGYLYDRADEKKGSSPYIFSYAIQMSRWQKNYLPL